jgi:hypothetical protein
MVYRLLTSRTTVTNQTECHLHWQLLFKALPAFSLHRTREKLTNTAVLWSHLVWRRRTSYTTPRRRTSYTTPRRRTSYTTPCRRAYRAGDLQAKRKLTPYMAATHTCVCVRNRISFIACNRTPCIIGLIGILLIDIHSFCSLSYDRSVASSKASSPQSAI